MASEIVADVKRDYIIRLLKEGKRADGRAFDQMREIKIERRLIGTAEGSAKVKLGDTTVLVGIKVLPGEPYPDSPDSGVMSVNAELVPMASPRFETGPPSPDAIELARVVDRGIRESEAVDFDSLGITSGEKVWMLYVDIHVLDYDGNLFDASTLGVLAALDNTVVPGLTYDYGEDRPLDVNHWPVSVTMVKIAGQLLVDPSLDEEAIAEGRLTITTDEKGHIRATQKGIGSGFTLDEIKQAVELATRVGNEVRRQFFDLDDVVGGGGKK